jgi:DNA-binding GntR family transcriptional regulator
MVEEQVISLSETAYNRLREEILLGNLMPGAVVSERELASRYDMSKTPIREAVTQVCREGLMQRLPGRGYMVSPITIKEIQDLYDMRLILELATLENMIRKSPKEYLEKLKQISKIKYIHGQPNSHIVFLEANRDFHLTLAEATGNRRLFQTLEVILIEMDRLFHLGLRLRDFSTEMQREHEELVAAIEKGDEKAAKESMTNQIMTSKNRILEAIMKGEFQPIQVEIPPA